ncbi:MAG: hypothetical protein K1060chlam2_00625 [Chlamydiae bacterium]|nr:hypothetical protein [Chlamydiota bacterium]
MSIAGNFSCEVINRCADTYTYCETYIVDTAKTQINTIKNGEDGPLKTTLNILSEDKRNYIGAVIFSLGMAYHFYGNKAWFTSGAVLGFFASRGNLPKPLRIESIEVNQVQEQIGKIGHISGADEKRYLAQKLMLLFAVAHWYIGKSRSTNAIFGLITGGLSTNCIYGQFQGGIEKKIKSAQDWDNSKWGISTKVHGYYNDAATKVHTFFHGGGHTVGSVQC